MGPARKVKRNRLILEKRALKGVAFSLLTQGVEKAAVIPHIQGWQRKRETRPTLAQGKSGLCITMRELSGGTPHNHEGVKRWDTSSGEMGVHKTSFTCS